MWWSRNEDGVWCNWCGERIFPSWFDEYENGDEPEYCPNCKCSDDEGPNHD
jgi:hypothetical protein